MSTFYPFNSAELQGAGTTSSIDFLPNTPYVFQLPNYQSGSVYFVLETVRNTNQIYDSSSPKNFTGIIFPTYQTVDMIKSEYIVGFVLNQGDNRFVLYPNNYISGSSLYLRATGDTNLEIEETALASGTWDTTTTNWESESNLWGV
jgi:hypothetical protein